MDHKGWTEKKIGELGRVVTGKTPPGTAQEYFGDHIPFLTPTDMDGRRMMGNTQRWLSDKGAALLARLVVPRGVSVSCIGWQMGKAVLLDRSAATNQQINTIVPDPLQVDARFLYYSLSSRRDEIFHLGAGGSRTPILKKSDFERIRISLPPLSEQRAIAHILGTLDDKIELNRRMNETLAGMARAIFKSWFVDFDPVRAKADGRRPAGMDPATAALFPDSFDDSPLGKIPKGWTVGTVDDHFRLTMGQSPPGSTYNGTGEGIEFYQGRTDFGFRYPIPRVYCTAPTRFAEPEDTLVSVRAPVGSVNMTSRRCAVGRGVAAIRHSSGSISFTYYAMQNLEPEFLRFEAEGTVFGSISKADFHRLQFVEPKADITAAFERLAHPMDERILLNERESLTLSNCRDTLLPKLLSGDLPVPQGE